MALQPYKKQDWIDHQVDEATSEIIVLGTPVDKIHLDYIENGIQTADTHAIKALDKLEKKPDAHVITTRQREPDKPDYGVDTEQTMLHAMPYTGTSEIAMEIGDQLYDTNMSTSSSAAQNGTILLKKLED